MRFFLRMLGFLLVAGAFIFVVVDGTRYVGSSIYRPVKVGDVWVQVSRDSLLLLQPAIERHVSPFLWDPVMLSILTAPAFAVFGGLGLLLLLLGRRREARTIGYGRD
jgi:hypothetical protein